MSSRSKNVLILTHSNDAFVIERVTAALEKRGARAIRFDTDLFPSEVRLSARLSKQSGEHVVRIGDERIAVDDFDAVWARKIWTPRIPADVPEHLAAGCVRESGAALSGFLDGLHGARWINPLGAGIQAENKLFQLRVAADVGLALPETLVTNDPDAVRAFHAEHAPLVAKMLTPLSVSMQRAELFVHTSAVTDDDLVHLDGLASSPMVFQSRVEKDVELRVACVGEHAFAGAIDASRSALGRVDWRRARPDEVRWQRADVPEDVASRLRALLARLGLVYGAVDLIRTPDGEHVFLEINPAGEWGMLEHDLGLPISDAIAGELVAAQEKRT
jgi:glutathione synthase/RimK-type ligase-like ATP-grasp enzyme